MKTLAFGAVLIALLAAREGVAQEKKSWTDNLSLSGDTRFRFQNTEEEGKEGRERWRFRGRLSLKATVSEEVTAGIRVVTNTGDPVSDNQTMSGAFDDKDARFDRAFFTWTPVSDLSLTFGKMAQPWISVSDLIFAGDVNPEGLALGYRIKGDKATLALNGGAFVVEERSSAAETSLYSGQASARINTGGKNYLLVGASIYAYNHVEGFGLLYNPANSFGNSTRKTTQVVDGKEVETLLYANEYTLVEAFAEAGFDVGLPLTVGVQYVVNTEADSDDTGYLGQITLGRARDAGTWAFGYQYRYLEKDAILGVFGESTDFGSGSNVKGHIPFVQYAITKNFDVKAQYAFGQKGVDNGKDIETFKIDLSAKF
ncbi:MAG: putative porin [Kiritimatiellia bacterium]|nr:putative porin [Kiritimatiellia bacterium]